MSYDKEMMGGEEEASGGVWYGKGKWKVVKVSESVVLLLMSMRA